MAPNIPAIKPAARWDARRLHRPEQDRPRQACLVRSSRRLATGLDSVRTKGDHLGMARGRMSESDALTWHEDRVNTGGGVE